jgi:hypothetical protein
MLIFEKESVMFDSTLKYTAYLFEHIIKLRGDIESELESLKARIAALESLHSGLLSKPKGGDTIVK